MSDRTITDREQFIQEINSRSYSQAFRLAHQATKQTPYEYICDTIKRLEYQEGGTTFLNSDDISQALLINEIERLGEKHYKDISKQKHLELINTIRPQWGDKVMTPDARKFALMVLGILENMDKNRGR